MMNNKITIVIQDKNFELGLDCFSEAEKEEIRATFEHKTLNIQTLLAIYLKAIQEKHKTNAKIKEILEKINF